MRCKDCENNVVGKRADCEKCANCSHASPSEFYEDPRDRWIVRAQLSAEYRRRLGYSTAEPGAEMLEDDE